MSIICKTQIPPHIIHHISSNTEVMWYLWSCDKLGILVIWSFKHLFSVVRQLNKWDIWSQLLKCLLAHSSCCEISDKLRSNKTLLYCSATTKHTSLVQMNCNVYLCLQHTQKVGKSTVNYNINEVSEEQMLCFSKLMLHRALTSYSATQPWSSHFWIWLKLSQICLKFWFCQLKGRTDTIFM